MGIQANVGPADRLVRLVVGVSLVGFGVLGVFPGGWGWVVPVIGAVVALTALIGYCPLYRLLGLGWKPGVTRNGGGPGA